MAASIKVSELQELLSLTSDDLFLVTDLGSGSSRKVSYATLTSGLEAQIGTSQATLQANIDTLRADLTYDLSVETSARTEAISTEITARSQAVSALQAAIDAVQSDVDQNEADADAAIAAETSARTLAVTDETTAREQAVAALQALIDALQTESSSRLTRIETLETSLDNLDIDISPETLNSINELAAALGNDADFVTTINDAIAALQADVDQNESDADAADVALSARLDVLETDPTTAAALAAVQADVDQNEADADAAIAALQSTIDALDIDIAPETLNSIDELAAAMGDDPTFLTTLQNRVTIIENDNATQTELNDYIAHIEARNLEAGLATGVLYADTIYGG